MYIGRYTAARSHRRRWRSKGRASVRRKQIADFKQCQALLRSAYGLLATGEYPGALRVATDAQAVAGRLVVRDSGVQLISAMADNVLGCSLHRVGRTREGLDRLTAAVVALRATGKRGKLPKPSRLLLVEVLSNRAGFCGAIGLYDDAIRSGAEALALLAKPEPRTDLARRELATAMLNHGANLFRVGELTDALRLTDDARQLYGSMCQPFPAGVARCLSNRAAILHIAGRYPDALVAAQDAIAIRRAAGDEQRVGLAQSLVNLSDCLHRMDRPAEAVQAGAEAVEILRSELDHNPNGHAPHLAQALAGRAAALRSAGRTDDALADADEAYTTLRRLTEIEPRAYRDDLAYATRVLAEVLESLGRTTEARRVCDEAVAEYEPLAAAWPGRYRRLLAETKAVRERLNGWP
jgi:tetratricopeptide (TPR) repeat protein